MTDSHRHWKNNSLQGKLNSLLLKCTHTHKFLRKMSGYCEICFSFWKERKKEKKTHHNATPKLDSSTGTCKPSSQVSAKIASDRLPTQKNQRFTMREEKCTLTAWLCTPYCINTLCRGSHGSVKIYRHKTRGPRKMPTAWNALGRWGCTIGPSTDSL